MNSYILELPSDMVSDRDMRYIGSQSFGRSFRVMSCGFWILVSHSNWVIWMFIGYGSVSQIASSIFKSQFILHLFRKHSMDASFLLHGRGCLQGGGRIMYGVHASPSMLL